MRVQNNENNCTEIFKDIPTFEGLYQVSNLGRVKSLPRTYIQNNGYGSFPHRYKERFLKPYKTKQGYLMIGLSKGNKSKLYLLHRIVALTFIPNPIGYKEVNHKNAIKDDNRVENLEWCNRKYNQMEAERMGLVHSPMRNSGINHPSNKAICMIDDGNNVIKQYYSITQAGVELNIPMKHISYCLRNGKKDKYIKKYWKYKEK